MNSEQDNVRRIYDELVRYDLISSNIKVKKCDGLFSNRYFWNTIYYKSDFNTFSDDCVVCFIGHEYGHQKLPQYSKLIFSIVILIILIEGYILIKLISIFLLTPILTLILTPSVLLWKFSKWLQEDENRSDIVGAIILLKYGRLKGKNVKPSKSFIDLFDKIKINPMNKNVIFDHFIHLPDIERVKRLEKFEQFYFSQNQE